MYQIDIANQTLCLLPQKALYWPQKKILVVADIHFGKAASFRALGVPAPHGTTAQNLMALDNLLQQFDVAQIVFLGDFLHARAAHTQAALDKLSAWRAQHSDLHLTLIRGNHDRHAGDPAAILQIEVVNEPYQIAPFLFCHHPDLEIGGERNTVGSDEKLDVSVEVNIDSARYILAGHLHPAFRLRSRSDSIRLPCFLVGAQRMILPAFGAFTGGHNVQPSATERVFITTGEEVMPI